MASESVEILIEADNRASAKFKELNKDVDASVKQIKEVGGQSKASTELVGSLANSLGGSAIGGFAGEIAMLTERVSAFSEVAKAGSAGAIAFQAGLAGVAAVVSFKVGKAIGDVVFQTEKWSKALLDAGDNARRLQSEIAKLQSQRYSQELAAVESITDAEERRNAALQKRNLLAKDLEANRQRLEQLTKEPPTTSGFGLSAFLFQQAQNRMRDMDALKEQIEQQEAALELNSQQNQELNKLVAGEQHRVELARQKAAEEEASAKQSEAFVQTLRDELELLRATKEEQFAIQAARGTANNDDRTEAEQLLRERDAILAKKEAEKAAEAERKRMAETRAREAEAERKRIESVKSGIVDKLRREAVALKDGQVAARAYALEMQGIEKGLANQIAQTEALLGQKSKDIDLGVNATQGRLITRGRSDSIASKTEKNTAEIAKEMKRLADLLERNPSQKIELKQGGV